MPDLCMCLSTVCDKRQTCYRFIAEPSPCRQSYFADEKLSFPSCGAYIEAKAKSQVRRLDIQTAPSSEKGGL